MHIKYGTGGNTIEKPANQIGTLENLLADDSIRTVLGIPENVDAVVNGHLVDETYRFSDNDTVEFVTRANCKG